LNCRTLDGLAGTGAAREIKGQVVKREVDEVGGKREREEKEMELKMG
jgi:hypothetical protein